MTTIEKAKNPEFWKGVREKDCYAKFRNELLANWEKFCKLPVPALKYSEFILFKKTGDRSIYQKPYFERRQALNTAALLALTYPDEEKYVTFLLDIIYAVCDEYTWCLPAHQGNLDVNNNCRIDLFAAETGFALSEIYTLLGNRLEPLICDRIRTEIDRRIVAPFTAVDNYGWWEKGTNNWNAVCTGSVACTFMYMHPDMARDMIPRFKKAIDCFLSGFYDDGMCLEGCGYWHYGFGFFTVYADMIRDFTNGEVDYFKDPKVKTIATFIQKMFLTGQASVSFADGGRKLAYHLGIVHYLKDQYPDDVLAYSPEFSYNYDNCGRWCKHIRSALWLNEEYYNAPADDNVSQVCYAPDSQWFVKRTPCYGFAAKGGNNNEHHNHNDVGTFIFAKDGKQLIMDLGSGAYTRQYFAKDTRYTMLECSSRGHNVPVIGGAVQGTGKQFASKNTSFENGVFSTDIAGAYGIDELSSLKRSFSFTDETVTLRDEFCYSGNGEIVERFVSYEPMTIEGNTVNVSGAVITFDPEKYSAELSTELGSRNLTCNIASFTMKPGVDVFEAVIS